MKQSARFPIHKLWPLALVPLTLFLVKNYGHSAGNLLLGAVFAYLFIKKSDIRTRRLMVVLAVMGAIFETANVAAGLYSYFGTLGSPLWISLGWALLGWWVASLEPILSRVRNKAALYASGAAVMLFPLLNGNFSLSSPIAVAGLYALSLASTLPFAVYAFAALFAILAEYAGTFAGVWGYFNPAGTRAAVPPDLAGLAMAYAIVLAFCFWVSGYETLAKKR